MPTLSTIIYTGVASTDGTRTGRVRASDDAFDLPYIPPVPGPWDGQPGTNPEQLLAAAWSICFHGLLGLGLRTREIDAGDMRVNVSVELGETGDKALGLAADITVAAPGIDDAVLKEVLDEAYQRCPFCQAMHGNIRVGLHTAG